MIKCPICDSNVHFFTSKMDRLNQKYEYFICEECNFLFDKDLVLDKQSLRKRAANVYQEDYFQHIDTGWKVRGNIVFKRINRFLKIYKFIKFKKDKEINVLDYGGGNGYITSKVNNKFNVFYYDKYTKPTYATDNYKILDKPFKTDIVYAVEVVEHITNMEDWDLLNKICSDVLIFTTELSDGINNQELAKWWYLNPDFGHTSIYSSHSLYLLAKKYDFCYFFFPCKYFHIFFKNSFLSQFNFVKSEFLFYNFLKKIKHIVTK